MMRTLFLIAALALTSPANAALTFFWRAEGTTLSGTDDFSAGDTTATAAGSVTLDAAALRQGSTGILSNADFERYGFDHTSITDRLVGSACTWIQFPTTFGFSEDGGIRLQGALTFDFILVTVTSGGEGRLNIRNNGGSAQLLETSGAGMTAGNWYFLCGQWDQPNNDRRISVYSTSLTLLDDTEDLSTAYTAPSALDAGNGVRLGQSDNASARSVYHDNIFIGSAYADATTFVTNADITSYTSYGGGGGGGGQPPRSMHYNRLRN